MVIVTINFNSVEKKRNFLTWLFVVSLLVVILAGFTYLPHDKISTGVFIENLAVGGYTKAQAKQMLASYEREKDREKIHIVHQDEKWTYTIAELGFYLAKDEVVEAAFNVGRQGNGWTKLSDRCATKLKSKTIPYVWLKDEKKAMAAIAPISEKVETPAIDASLTAVGDNLQLSPHSHGIAIDTAQFWHNITQVVMGDIKKEEIPLVLKDIPPNITTTAVENMGVNVLLSKFTTQFDQNLTNRVHNIQLAATSLENLLLPPNAEFSFNQATGPRTKTNGFREAPIIIDNQLASGVGGGICQVSSTLYNSVLLANLEIVERRRHSLQVNYVPVGMDATVADNYIDFKFKNNTDYYLLIKADIVEGNQLTIRIFGNNHYKKQVEVLRIIEEVFPPQVSYEIDPTLLQGEKIVKKEGKPGYRTKVMRIIREKGQVASEELISHDTYPAEERIILKSVD